MSATDDSRFPNQTSQYEGVDAFESNWNILFGLSLVIATVTCLGGLYSIMSLLRMSSRSSICFIVASISIDDLISVVPLTLFMILQWRSGVASRSGVMCTLSGSLYVFQGVSSNMKACLIVVYTFYVTKRFGVYQTPSRPLGVFVAVVAVWMASLIVSVLPVCGWGRFTPTSLGCFPEKDSLYTLVIFAVYSLCFCGLVVCSVPLIYQLMCSTEALKTFSPSYFEIAGSGHLCEMPSLSQYSLKKCLGAYNEFSSKTGSFKNKTDTHFLSNSSETGNFQKDRALSSRYSTVFFSQKRFSLIMAMARMVLWMPMMTQILVSHAVHMHSSSLETFSFFLTLLSTVVTPVFMLSEHWIHLPCGCFINCHQGLGSELSNAKKRRFEFKLSFQQEYGIYKIPHGKSQSVEKPYISSLYSCNFSGSRVAVLDSVQIGSFSTMAVENSSIHSGLLLEERSKSHTQSSTERERQCRISPQVSVCDREDLHLDNSSVFNVPERRLSHEECHKIELTDWEWCRSKSERTPRQRSMAGLAIPICAFQGTVSLHAPTGKTLSLSTYEVSSDGLKISPNNTKKVEVYRSKSVGHEPSVEEPNSSTKAGGVCERDGVADTNVKIHLEVLEICDNEEAMDSVSIVSNISQSSTHARSPSLRYSRRENRFVSCDLGETASYSLLIPSSNPDTDNINIHIPDTVEAHRQNSLRQHREAEGYQEEIQLLNEAYKRQERDQGN